MATLSGWHNSSAWDEPDQAPAFPECAIEFEELEAWVAVEIAENHPDVDADEVAADAVQTWLDFTSNGNAPEIVHPIDLKPIETAMARAVRAYQAENIMSQSFEDNQTEVLCNCPKCNQSHSLDLDSLRECEMQDYVTCSCGNYFFVNVVRVTTYRADASNLL